MPSKNLLLIICLLASLTLSSQSCFPEGLAFSAQSQIDQFAAVNVGCKKLIGNLTILGKNIKNLDGLSQITEVEGDIYITSCDSIINIDGLKNIQKVGGAIRIQNNPQLMSIGFQHLRHAKGDFFYISSNPKIKSLSGMNRLDSISGIFQIWNQDSITSLTGLDSLTFVGKDIAIFKNKNLNSLNGLSSLVHVGDGFRVYENATLSTLDALPVDLKIEGPLVINDNPTLSDCAARAICEYIKNPSSFMVFNNNSSGCGSVSDVQTACISSGDHLTSIDEIKIYPNPASEFITFEGIKFKESVATLYDINGQTLMKMDVKQQPSFDISHLPVGLYIIKVGSFYSKLYIQR